MLRYNGRNRLIVVLNLLVWLALLVGIFLSYLDDNPTATPVLIAIFAGVFLIMFTLMVHVLGARVFVSRHGLVLWRPLLGAVELPWKELEACRYSHMFDVFTLRPKGGRTRWLSIYFNGLGRLRQQMDCHAPGVLEASAREALPVLEVPPGLHQPSQLAGSRRRACNGSS